MREGLCTLIEKQPDMEVVGEAENGRVAVQRTHELAPEVVVMDIAMPDLNGIEATRQILTSTPGVKVIGLSMHSAERFVVEMLKAGSSGYLLKDCAFEELLLAIRTVLAGNIYVSPGIRDTMIQDYVRDFSKTQSSVNSILTPREGEVLQLLAEGRTTKQIALSLRVSTKTVETYRRQVMRKLKLYSVAELTKFAVREGITSMER
jgi:DNA-binding NarL/FixJ family response regulator